MADPYAANVVLQLAGNFTADTSPSPVALTFGAGVQSSVIEKKYVGSRYFSTATSTSRISTSSPTGSRFAIGGDFTVQLWVKPTTSGEKTLLMGIDGIYEQFSLTLGADDVIRWSESASFIDGDTITRSVWTHIAVSRVGTKLYIFKNGVLYNSKTVTIDAWVANTVVSMGYVTDGGGSGSAAPSTYVEDVQITKGVGRYTANFTPPDSLIEVVTSINASVSAPIGSVSAFFGSTTLVSAPKGYLTAFTGAAASITSPTPFISASGSQKTNGAIISSPSPKLDVAFGSWSELKAPKFLLDAAMTGANIIWSSMTAPSPIVSASGTIAGKLQTELTNPIGSLIGYCGAVVSISLTGKPTVSSTVTTGSVAKATLTCPLFQLTSTATAQNHGGALLTAPIGRLGGGAVAYLVAPMGKLTAIGSAVVSVTYEAYSVNLGHRDPEAGDEVTRYTNYPFDRIVRYKNSYFGMNSTGLYLLDSGALDAGTEIPYEVKTQETDFGDPNHKTIVSAYFGGKLGPAEKVTLFVGEKTTQPYSYTTPRGANPQTYRQVFGKGIKARYYAIGVSGSKEFELDTVDFEVAKLKRRI